VDPDTAELLVRGDTVFQEYWGRPEQTKKEFNAEGWFTTGDAVVLDEVEVTRPDGTKEMVQSYKITGRMSVDILKSGGYKISALDVEATLLEHPLVAEVAVVGVADLEYGQKVAAIVALHDRDPKATLELPELRAWAKERMAGYKCPSVLRVLPSIPRNAMGKVNKKALILDLFP
jgi:malonyl-CoA/methylmalonyl-CoA synthetase